MSFADPHAPRGPHRRGDAPSATVSGRVRRGPELRARDPHVQDDDEAPLVQRARGASFRRVPDWERVGLVGAGLVVGVLLGVGTTLLIAPQSGRETRIAIGRRARSARYRASDAWDDLANELSAAARRGRRRARRALQRARWRASDAMA
jgi:hypothetical protein